MKAMVVVDKRLVWRDIPDPIPGPEEVLVRIRATALNRADLLQRRGLYPPPAGATEIMGLECAGTIEVARSEVTGWEKGQRVCALLPGGGYAERVSVPHQMLLSVPDAVSLEEAAAFPEVFYTAYLNLFIEGGLTKGESVLIHSGASGVGTAAIQLAKNAGTRVAVTVGSDEKADACIALGADLAILYRSQDFAEEIQAWTRDSGVDVILDTVGGAYLSGNLRSVATGGRIVVIGLLGGSKTEINLGQVLTKRIQIKGSTLRSRPLEEKIALTERIRADVLPPWSAGTVKPVLDQTFPISDVEAAHDRMEKNLNIGKIVLTVQ